MIRLRRMLVVVTLMGLMCHLARGVAEEEWPQFRGPTGQGIAKAHDLPVVFDDKKNVAWKVAIEGTGWSSPVIAGNQIWLTTSTDAGHSLRAICVDRAAGKVVRDIEVFAPTNPPAINAKNSYASPTPVLNDGRLFVHFGTLGTACVDCTSGSVLWRNTEVQLNHKEGPGSSPIVYEDLVIVNCDGLDVQAVVAFHQSDGKIAWRATRPGPLDSNPDFRKAYSTPLLIGRFADPANQSRRESRDFL